MLELSSFQLETIESFRADIGAALNVTPDHLDRHYTLERYAAAKARLFENQRPGDFAVLNADDPATRSLRRQTGKRFGSARREQVSAGRVDRGRPDRSRRRAAHGNARRFRLRGRAQSGEHHGRRADRQPGRRAARDKIRAAVMTFPGVEHRLEFVRELDGVAWYNDSKATNVDATLKAIAAFPGGPVGDPRRQGQEHATIRRWRSRSDEKAHAVLLIGAAAEKSKSQLRRRRSDDFLRHARSRRRRKPARGRVRRHRSACAGLRQLRSV